MIVRLDVNLNKEVYVFVAKKNLNSIISLKWSNLVTFLKFVRNVECNAIKKM